MVALLTLIGIAGLAFDVSRLTIGGGWLLTVVCWTIAAGLSGLFRREVWIASDQDAAEYTRIDREVSGA